LKEVLALAERTWDAKEHGTLDKLRDEVKHQKPKRTQCVKPKDLETKQAKRRSDFKHITTPQTRSDLAKMGRNFLWSWIRSQGVRVKQHLKQQETLALAERTWDAKESGTLDNLTKKPKPKTLKSVELKSPQIRSDLARMYSDALASWIRSQGVAVKQNIKLPTEVQALAKKVWDAKESGTLDNLTKNPSKNLNPV
jgi:hypothetical protein